MPQALVCSAMAQFSIAVEVLRGYFPWKIRRMKKKEIKGDGPIKIMRTSKGKEAFDLTTPFFLDRAI